MDNWKRKNKLGIITLLVTMIILGLTDISSALDVNLDLRTRGTVSDNINRAPVGSERDGYLLTTEADLSFTSKVGTGTATMGIGGGWETLDDGDASDSDTSRLGFEFLQPWSRTGYVLGSVTYVDATEEPDITDISQERVRTKTIEKRLEVGNQPAVNASWQVAVTDNTEKRFDRDKEENEAVLIYEAGLDRINSLITSVGLVDGEEKINNDTWTRSSLLVDIQRNQSPVTSKGYRINWESQRTEQGAGAHFRTHKLGMVTYYETEMGSGMTYASEVGLDLIKPRSNPARLEPYIKVDLLGTPERPIQKKGSIYSAATLADPLEDRAGCVRDTQLQGSIAWRVTRIYTVEPIVRYRLAEIHGNNTASRTDETRILRLETRLDLYGQWLIQLNTQTEEVSSTQAAYDLQETRFELSIEVAIL